MEKIQLKTDFCVVGGGLAGMAAAIYAARHGAKTILVQDRPVLGGNSSSEIRMHVCGAHGENRRETGFVEELLLENHYRNHLSNYSIWDGILHGKATYQENLTVLMNTSVRDGVSENGVLKSITAWQLTTEKEITIEATLFADCSGDGILAPISGADFRKGREARAEFNEPIAPVEADDRTMGMSCLFQAREYPTPQPFNPFPWANDYKNEEGIEKLKRRNIDVMGTNFWWMEVGGMVDSIGDAEQCREELLRIAFGVWDYVKNFSSEKEKFANFALDWQGFLPGKRESRRYYGDHIMTQHDVEAGGKFDDIVAYGGWSMDDHFPAGFHHIGPGTIYHAAPSPYGIPYRSLYSRNISNLFCAGRCHSATHTAMSSTRVMATCALMGQAVGTAAAIAIREKTSPRGVYESHIKELQNTLMDDDCWLPGVLRPISDLSKNANLVSSNDGNVELLRNGMDRDLDGDFNAWEGKVGDTIAYMFDTPSSVEKIRLVFDSNLTRVDPSRKHERPKNLRYYHGLNDVPLSTPETIVKDFKVEILDDSGNWVVVDEIKGNYQRLVRVDINKTTAGVRITPLATWGAEKVRIFAFEAM